MSIHPRVLSIAAARPPYRYRQDDILAYAQGYLLGEDWHGSRDGRDQALRMARLFAATSVEVRHSAIDLPAYYAGPRTTGERMATFQVAGVPLGRAALERCLGERESGRRIADDVSDLVVVSCTGYAAPGLDILLARDLKLRPDVRRVCIGHMGCYGALVGLRDCLATLRADRTATAALLSIELASLHFMPTLDSDALTAFALFGDAAVALALGWDSGAPGPELVDTYCAADFAAADQMSWTITDQGFIMGLSPRVPVTLRRNVRGVVERLLGPHDLTPRDVRHWLVHPGGPSILQVVQDRLELSDEQMALAWRTLRSHGNCSSATVLLMLDALLREGGTCPGEWGVLMAFGPGLTLETALVRF